MGFLGGSITAAAGSTEAIVLAVEYEAIGTGLVATCSIYKPFRNRYLAPFINGVYYGRNLWCGWKGVVTLTLPPNFNAGDSTIVFEDAGDWAFFDDPADVPDEDALAFEDDTAKQFALPWTKGPQLSSVRGDAQLANIAISGALRGFNVGAVADMPTRGLLWYSISSSGGDHLIQWWMPGEKPKLVAEGTRSGDGAVVMEAVGSSGLSVEADLTYTGDVVRGTAELELRWMAEFQIHYEAGEEQVLNEVDAPVLNESNDPVLTED